MNENRIEDHEVLYRVVKHSYPDAFIDGKPTSALFMDGGGVSVDRNGERDEDAIIKTLKNVFGMSIKLRCVFWRDNVETQILSHFQDLLRTTSTTVKSMNQKMRSKSHF